IHAEKIQLLRNQQLVLEREVKSFALRPIPQRRVVDFNPSRVHRRLRLRHKQKNPATMGQGCTVQLSDQPYPRCRGLIMAGAIAIVLIMCVNLTEEKRLVNACRPRSPPPSSAGDTCTNT